MTILNLYAIILPVDADVAHLVERHLAKVEVASSSLVIRSIADFMSAFFYFERKLSMTYKYKTKGVCASHIELELEGEIIKNVRFIGGCSGNTQGVAALVKGMNVNEAVKRLEGIKCGFKPTSCPDQLAKALKEALA